MNTQIIREAQDVFYRAILDHIQTLTLVWETDLYKIDFANIPYTFPPISEMQIVTIQFSDLLSVINQPYLIEADSKYWIHELTRDERYSQILSFVENGGKLAPPLIKINYTDIGNGQPIVCSANILDGNHRFKLAIIKAMSMLDTIPIIITQSVSKLEYPLIKNIVLSY
jgi:hypothetical protein